MSNGDKDCDDFVRAGRDSSLTGRHFLPRQTNRSVVVAVNRKRISESKANKIKKMNPDRYKGTRSLFFSFHYQQRVDLKAYMITIKEMTLSSAIDPSKNRIEPVKLGKTR